MNYIKKLIKSILIKLPYVSELYKQNQLYKKNSCFPPGHFYSPIVLVDEIEEFEKQIWEGLKVNTINGINLNVNSQKLLIDEVSRYYNKIPFKDEKSEGLRYYFNNGYFRHSDGIFLFGMINALKPARIIEVGSGFSSALILDTNEIFFKNQIKMSFIEPYPFRLKSLLKEIDLENAEIIEKKVQNVDVEYFKKLKKGDILFIDSSHVSKCGSDLNYILFNILPILNSGVYLHFHDVFYPFEYPKEWVLKGRNWNENYILKAFLMYNTEFDIILFSHYLHVHHKDILDKMPLLYKDTGGSLWLEKR